MLTRRQFLPSVGGLAIAQTLPGCGWVTDKPIAVAGHIWVGYEPTFLAREEGWINRSLVKLIDTKSATQSLQALADSQVDGAMLTLDETLRARASGVPLTVVMVFDVSAGADCLLVRPEIKALADLKGRRVGYEQSAVGELMLAVVLDRAALTKQDVQLIPVNIDGQRNAWIHKDVDAVITYEPVTSQILDLQGNDRGAFRLFDTRQAPNLVTDVLAIKSNLLDREHTKAIQMLIEGHFRGLRHLRTNPQDAAYRMAARLGLPASEVLSAYKGLLLPDADGNGHLLSKAEPELLASAKNLSKIMLKYGLLKQDDSLQSLINSEYLPVALNVD